MSQQNRPVPGIAKGPQGFSQRNLPPISNPMGQQPMQQESVDVSIEDDLAMEIYARLAVSHIQKQMPDRETLRTLASQSRIAAQAYFEVNNA